MAKQNILSQAIADAKELKATAVANAKIALEETFTPTLQRMVSSKIQEEEGEDEEVDIDLNFGGEEGGDEGGMGFDSGEEEEAPTTEGEEGDDLELESLMRELDGDDEFAMEEGDEMEGFEDEEMMEGEEDEFQSFNPSAEEGEVNENDEMYGEDELEEALNAVLEMDGLGDDLDMGQEKEDGSTFTDHSIPSGPQFLERRKLRNENKQLKLKLQKIQKSLNESLRANVTYKKVLNEVNLLNAKLMYNTKALRQFDLTEGQQERILNSFDRANTVREVKLIYTTVCEALNKKTTKKLTEGSASRTVQQINPKRNLNESNDGIVKWTPNRLQELANIKKSDLSY